MKQIQVVEPIQVKPMITILRRNEDQYIQLVVNNPILGQYVLKISEYNSN